MPHFLIREDLRRLDQITKQTLLLCREQIDTAEQLISYQEAQTAEVGQLQKERAGLYRRVRRCGSAAEKEALKKEARNSSARIKEHHANARLCGDILERSSGIRHTLSLIQREERQKARRYGQKYHDPVR